MPCTHFDEKTHAAYLSRIDPKDRQREDIRLRAFAGVELVPAPKRSQVYVSEYRQSGGDFRYVNQDNSLGQSWTELHKPTHSIGEYRPLPDAFVEQAMAAKERWAKDPTVSKAYMVSPAVRVDGVVQHPGSEYSYVVEINFLSDDKGGTRMVVIHREGPKDPEELRKFFIALTGKDPAQKGPLKDGDTGFDLVVVHGDRASGDQFKTTVGQGTVTLNDGVPHYQGKGRYVDPYAAMKLPPNESNNLPPATVRHGSTLSGRNFSSEGRFTTASREERSEFSAEQTHRKEESSAFQWVNRTNNYQQSQDLPTVQPTFATVNKSEYQWPPERSSWETHRGQPSYTPYIPEYLRSCVIEPEALFKERRQESDRATAHSIFSSPLQQEPQFFQESEPRQQWKSISSPSFNFFRAEEKHTEAESFTPRPSPLNTSRGHTSKRARVTKEVLRVNRAAVDEINLQPSEAKKQMLRGVAHQRIARQIKKIPTSKRTTSAKTHSRMVKTISALPRITTPNLKQLSKTSIVNRVKDLLRQTTVSIRQKFSVLNRITEGGLRTFTARVRTQITKSIVRLRAYFAPSSPTSITSRIILCTKNLVMRARKQALAFVPYIQKIKLLPKILQQHVLRILAKIRTALAQTRPIANFTPYRAASPLAFKQNTLSTRQKYALRKRMDDFLLFLEQLRRNFLLFLFIRKKKLRGYGVIRWIIGKSSTRVAQRMSLVEKNADDL